MFLTIHSVHIQLSFIKVLKTIEPILPGHNSSVLVSSSSFMVLQTLGKRYNAFNIWFLFVCFGRVFWGLLWVFLFVCVFCFLFKTFKAGLLVFPTQNKLLIFTKLHFLNFFHFYHICSIRALNCALSSLTSSFFLFLLLVSLSPLFSHRVLF